MKALMTLPVNTRQRHGRGHERTWEWINNSTTTLPPPPSPSLPDLDSGYEGDADTLVHDMDYDTNRTFFHVPAPRWNDSSPHGRQSSCPPTIRRSSGRDTRSERRYGTHSESGRRTYSESGRGPRSESGCGTPSETRYGTCSESGRGTRSDSGYGPRSEKSDHGDKRSSRRKQKEAQQKLLSYCTPQKAQDLLRYWENPARQGARRAILNLYAESWNKEVHQLWEAVKAAHKRRREHRDMRMDFEERIENGVKETNRGIQELNERSGLGRKRLGKTRRHSIAC
ncbi:hypothetical protein B0H66DRAFT_395879 [Apodospora peruviana]|uniref:Uncharacterized protein n=1 Tax=Apodospora peruviana TaxID=516989 RepID=A0AAE0HSS8_9PEZI|nr:hypothetical protein B0H66DRAFT_395879 [Apodospora peruviana]